MWTLYARALLPTNMHTHSYQFQPVFSWGNRRLEKKKRRECRAWFRRGVFISNILQKNREDLGSVNWPNSSLRIKFKIAAWEWKWAGMSSAKQKTNKNQTTGNCSPDFAIHTLSSAHSCGRNPPPPHPPTCVMNDCLFNLCMQDYLFIWERFCWYWLAVNLTIHC